MSAQLGPVAAFLGPVFLDSLTFKYIQSDDLWQGGAKVVLPGGLFALDAAPPPPDLGFGIKGGRFDHAGLQVDFQPPAQPELFPGVFLTHIGGAFGLGPVRLTGTAGISARDRAPETTIAATEAGERIMRRRSGASDSQTWKTTRR